jgi:hypothetical protein
MTRAIAKLIHDRPDAPDPEPAADRPRSRHAADGPGAAGRDPAQARSIRTTPSATPPTSACSRSSSPTPRPAAEARGAAGGQLMPWQIDEYLKQVILRAMAPTCTSSPAIRRASALYGELAPLRTGNAGTLEFERGYCTRSCRRPPASASSATTAPISPTRWVHRPLPRERIAPRRRHRRRVARDPVQGLTIDELKLPPVRQLCKQPQG